jgi:endonuclease YncB( thermonuclease family)
MVKIFLNMIRRILKKIGYVKVSSLYDVKSERFKGKTEKPIKAELIELYDGDTGWFRVKTSDFIKSEYIEVNVRMKGFNAPELKSRRKETKELEKQAGLICREKMKEKLSSDNVTILFEGIGVYGRFLGKVIVDNNDVSEYMIKNGYGIPYNGKGKAPEYSVEQMNMIAGDN